MWMVNSTVTASRLAVGKRQQAAAVHGQRPPSRSPVPAFAGCAAEKDEGKREPWSMGVMARGLTPVMTPFTRMRADANDAVCRPPHSHECAYAT